MRSRKIRGHKRRHRQIETWLKNNLELRYDLLDNYSSDHIDIIVHPWCDISLKNSRFPEPKGKTKSLMLAGLLDIYDSWKKQLDQFNKPYYLKIWLFEPRFSKSQVVCAVDEKVNFYNGSFQPADSLKELNLYMYGKLKDRLGCFKWEQYQDGDYYDNSAVGKPEDFLTLKDYNDSKKWFENLLKRPHITQKYETPFDDITEYYFFKKGYIWIGEMSTNEI